MSDADWKEGPGHLLGPQAGHREDGPGRFLLPRRRVGAALSSAEDLGGGDDADQPVQVVAVRGEIVGQPAQSRVELAGGGQVVDRLGQRAAEQEGPDAIDRRAGEVRVPAVDDPGGELLARAARAGSTARGRTARGDRP